MDIKNIKLKYIIAFIIPFLIGITTRPTVPNEAKTEPLKVEIGELKKDKESKRIESEKVKEEKNKLQSELQNSIENPQENSVHE